MTAPTPERLRTMAGSRSFERGQAYHVGGAVQSLRLYEWGVQARVSGTGRYHVELRLEDGELTFDCTCPVGFDGAFCKHCVAVGLAWHAEERDGGGRAEAGAAITEGDIRAHLMGLDKAELVSMLLDRARGDERLWRQLTLRAAQSRPEAAAASMWKRAFDGAAATGDYVGYREMDDYAAGIEEVIDGLDELLQAGHADSVIELAEYAVGRLETALERVDDSAGEMGALMHRLREVHLEACRQARPDPTALAGRLFALELRQSYDIFRRTPEVYADVLGEAGRAAFRRLAEAEWAQVPELAPGDSDPDRYGRRRGRLASIMEALAQADGDLDALVAVKARDLSHPHAFLQIAELCRDAGDLDRALAWAERGWQAFSDARGRNERLRDVLADAYQEQGRGDAAMALVWDAFAEAPCLATYRTLEAHAQRAGQWPDWRDRTLALVRDRLAAGSAPGRGRPMPFASSLGHSLLVEIFLHEDDPEAAWREALAGGCTDRLWLALAERREDSHPADAVRIYRRHVAGLLETTGDPVYREAVGYLERIGRLLARAGDAARFRALVAEVRTAHRRKRNLMKMLDRPGW